MTLASNLKLRRGSIHSEPAIELIGADPYKFAVRELGLINEQINWKQRFFVPSDETSGIDILESLLERYPVMLTEDSVTDGESNMAGVSPEAGIRPTEIVDLDHWIVAVGKVTPEQQTPDGSDRQVKPQEHETEMEQGQPFTLTPVAAVAWDSVSAKRANAIGVQLRLKRDRITCQKRDNPTGSCRVCRLYFCPR